MRSRFIAALGLLVAGTLPAQVAPNGSFGTLAGATFGGSGIPNTAVERGGVDGVTIGLTAHQRYVGPNLANDGMGTFYAAPGFGTAPQSTWNTAFYISGLNVANAGLYSFQFGYDVNNGVGVADYGSINISGTAILAAYGGTYQGSENLTFPFLYMSTSGPGYALNAPSGTYDPSLAGEYNFYLAQFDVSGSEPQLADYVAIDVEVTPEPASLILLGTGLLGVAVAARRRRSV